MTEDKLTLRAMYKGLERPGKHPLKNVHENLDKALREAYGISKSDNILEFL